MDTSERGLQQTSVLLSPGAGIVPRPLTSFIGREREVAEVRRLLDQARLLTLTGAGGCGKTRLALEVVSDLLAAYDDGVAIVELAGLSDPALVSQVVSANLEVPEVPQQPVLATLLSALRTQRLLLVLDNCEHLAEACARLADVLLRSCPRVQILATSREPLGVDGEVTWRVPSLAVPEPGSPLPCERLIEYAGVQLFVDRAKAVRPSFRMTPENAPATALVCRRLDGIPLAIELAAVWVNALSPEQIAERLDDRFRLLTGGSRAALPRQRTLRALVDWSYGLLREPERRLFRRLSIFAGGWTLEAAQVVCAGLGLEPAEILARLASLIDKSLVVADEQDGSMRYRLLETLQQYGAEKLEEALEAAELRRRHRLWCLALAEQAEAKFDQPAGAAWMGHLEIEHENLRAALGGWLPRRRVDTDHSDIPTAVTPQDGFEERSRLGAALWQFWDVRGHWSEGRFWLDALLAEDRDGAASPVRVKALHGAASLADAQGDPDHATAWLAEALALHQALGDGLGAAFTVDRLSQIAFRRRRYDDAERFAEESLALFRQLKEVALSAGPLDTLGQLARRRGDTPRAAALFEQSLAAAREAGDQRGAAAALRSLAQIATDRGDHARAAALSEECVALFREVGDLYGLNAMLVAGALAALSEGDYTRAEALLDESLTYSRRAGEKQAVAIKLRHLASTVQKQADLARAALLWQECLTVYRELNDQAGSVECLVGLSELAALTGQQEAAVRLLAARGMLRADVGAALGMLDRTDIDQLRSALLEQLGREVYGAAWAAGEARSLDEAIAEGWAAAAVAAERSTTPSATDEPDKSSEGSVRSPARLTRRELEVLRLLASGKSNQEIAADLVISIPTVETHVGHVYEKIGARGRADATAYAFRHALV